MLNIAYTSDFHFLAIFFYWLYQQIQIRNIWFANNILHHVDDIVEKVKGQRHDVVDFVSKAYTTGLIKLLDIHLVLQTFSNNLETDASTVNSEDSGISHQHRSLSARVAMQQPIIEDWRNNVAQQCVEERDIIRPRAKKTMVSHQSHYNLR